MQRGIFANSRSYEDEDQGYNIDCQLELEETLDVVEDVSSPDAGLND